MFLIDNKKRIKIVSGDTAIFDISVSGYNFVEGDKVYFTVKKNIDDTENAIQKIVTKFDGNTAKVILCKEDTNIPAGIYLYDVQCSLINGIVDTVVLPTKFEVLGGVTHD